jgi:hypothetical protein
MTVLNWVEMDVEEERKAVTGNMIVLIDRKNVYKVQYCLVCVCIRLLIGKMLGMIKNRKKPQLPVCLKKIKQ